jgi:putative hydrolase of HD superfamily
VIHLGQLALQFGRVERLTRHEDGIRLETDTDHTVALGLIACSLANRYYPQLDLGVLAQLSLVHDLPEVYAGDTPTLVISNREREAKHGREEAAKDRLWQELGTKLPWLPIMIDVYEWRGSAEARFVYCLDKLLPKVTHLLNRGAVLKDEGMNREDMQLTYKKQAEVLEPYFAEFPLLGSLYRGLYGAVLELEGL